MRMKTQQVPCGGSLQFIQYLHSQILLGTTELGLAGPSRLMDAGSLGERSSWTSPLMVCLSIPMRQV